MKKVKSFFYVLLLMISLSANAQVHNGHAYVDLGLSVKWATCNVGSNKPEVSGNFYAWGETKGFKEGKVCFDWASYKLCDGAEDKLTKYCMSNSYGVNDGKTVLELKDDAANANWGGSWRMPTKKELEELKNECTWTWTKLNNRDGYQVTSKTNGKSIFLPAAGYRDGTDLNNAGCVGYYWSSSLDEDFSGRACGLDFFSSSCYHSTVDRYLGRFVRAVCP